MSHLRVAFLLGRRGTKLKFKVRLGGCGLWEVVAPGGQVAGLCPTRWEADIAARGLIACQAFSTKEVAAYNIRAEHRYRAARERQMVARAEQADPALAHYLARRRARLGVAA